jgi:hypothetical protein
MGDITRIDAAQAVEITDGSSQSAALSTGVAGTEIGLVVREGRKGQTTMSASIPVTVASDQPGVSYAEDAGHVSGDRGAFILGVRNDSAGTTFTNSNGDYSPIGLDSAGRVLTAESGDIAHDSPDANAPVKIGGQARTTNPTAVADADRVNAIFDKVGRIITAPCQARQLVTSATITLTNGTETTLLAAGGAGVFHDMTMLTITNTSSTAVRVDIRDDTAGTVILSMYVAASGGGAVIPFTVPLSQTASNKNWTAQLSASVTDVRIFGQFAKNV